MRWGLRRYEPTCDLPHLALDVMNVLDQDRYRADDPELGTELPAVWLGGPKRAGLSDLLGATRAGVMVSGRLPPEFDARPEMQQLTVFVIELSDDAVPPQLTAIATEQPRSFMSVPVAEGRLFGLLVARSVMEGLPSHETAEGVTRFRDPLAEILRRYASRAAGSQSASD